MKSVFICDYCGKQFENDKFRCYIHEENCEFNPKRWVIIRVTCQSAIKDRSDRVCNECRDETCVNTVLVDAKNDYVIKLYEPYNYVNEYRSDGFRSGYRTYTSAKDPAISFRAEYR